MAGSRAKSAKVLDMGSLVTVQTLAGDSRRGLESLCGWLAPALDALQACVLVVDADDVIRYANAEVERLTGWRSDDLTGQPRPKVLLDREEHVRAALDSGSKRTGHARSLGASGGGLGVLLEVLPIVRRKVTVGVFIAFVERRERPFDALTGLQTREVFVDRVEQALSVARRVGMLTGIVALDVREMEDINRVAGRTQGDRVLRSVAEKISGAVRRSDTISRLGSDKFAVLLPDIREPADVDDVASKLATHVRHELAIPGGTCDVRVAVGVAVAERDEDAQELTMRAERALVASKLSPTEAARPRRERRVTLYEIKRAIAGSELVLYYQPQVPVTGDRVRLEALVRWEHPQLGLVGPGHFVPAAEANDEVMRSLTLWVAGEAVRQLSEWRRRGLHLVVSINLSARDLAYADLVQDLIAVLDKYGVPASALKAEVTEGAIMTDEARAIAILRELGGAGMEVSVDDYGTGRSALSYLQKLPVHELKIDQSFVRAMMQEERSSVIVASTIDMAHRLGFQTVAEGVETEEMWARLRGHGCDWGQGYHFAKPMPPSEVPAWVAGWARRQRSVA